MKMQQAITKSVEHPGDLQPQELRARELARGPVLMRRVREQVEGVAVGGAHHPRAFRVVGGPGGGEAQLAESGEGVGIRPATTRMKEQLLHALAECERIVDASLRHGASQFSPCNYGKSYGPFSNDSPSGSVGIRRISGQRHATYRTRFTTRNPSPARPPVLSLAVAADWRRPRVIHAPGKSVRFPVSSAFGEHAQ